LTAANKHGRVVVTNITGLDHEKIASYLGKDVAEIKYNLVVVDDDKINDAFWPDDNQGGFVPWGSVLVLDEAWKWFREKDKLGKRFWDYLRKHRKWAAGDPPANCEIVLITQSKTDLPRSIMSVVDQMWSMKKNLFSGVMSLYSLALYQPGNRKPLLQKNLKYNKKIFALYKSHSVANVVEVRASEGGSWWNDRKTWLGVVALVLAAAGTAWAVPGLLSGKIMPSAKADTVHRPVADKNGNLVTPGLEPRPSQPASVAHPSAATAIAPLIPSSASAPAEHPAAGAALGAAISSRVLQLRGDPDAVKAVGDAFCQKSGDCQTVVNAASQQVVLVGSDATVTRLEKLLGTLAVRPPSQLVRVVLFEADDSAADDLNLYAGVTGRSSLQIGSTAGPGASGALRVGSFSLAFNRLVGTGAVHLLSAPQVSIWPGQTAVVKSGLSVPILGSIITDAAGRQTQVLDYRDSGLILNLTQVSAGERPVLKLDIESSSYGDTQVGVTSQPTKSQRILSSMVELPPCEVVVIGGMDQWYQSAQVQKFLGITTNRSKDVKASHMYVALYGESGSSAHACAAPGSPDSATPSPTS
jgi:zona occludens toxin (predicted ATPase)